MRNTLDIDDPTWHDIFDRDKEIDRLRAEIERLRSANAELGVCLEWYIAEDDTNEGGRWDESNAHWIAGKRRAEQAIDTHRLFVVE